MSHSHPRWRFLRPFLHMTTGLFALALGVLPHWAAVGCGVGGILAGWVGFPVTGLEKVLRRPGERYLAGLRSYPVAILGLVVFLPPAEAAAAWGVLAFGDASAAVVGQLVPARKIFGHRKATWSGSTAHVVMGGCGAIALSSGVAYIAPLAGIVEAGPLPSIPACFLAALAAALADFLFRLPDDNLSGSFVAAVVLRAARALH